MNSEELSSSPPELGGDRGEVVPENKQKFKEIYNLKKYKNFRRHLRNNATQSERRLWNELKDKKLGYKFRRQYSVGKYILDLYCPEKRIAIEVDGNSHTNIMASDYDYKRDNYIKLANIKIIRVSVDDVINNLDGVLRTIGVELCSRSGLPPTPPNSRGEDLL